MDFYIIFWIIIAAISAGTPLILIKYYHETKKLIYLWMALFCYIILIFSYLIIINNRNIVVIYSIVKILSILFILLYAFIILNQKINVKIGLGILFGILSICLLSQH